MALRPAEGLCYVLKFRSDTPPTGPLTDERLVQEVVDFCLNGLRGGPAGARRTDALGEMTGVVNWLIFDGVTQAKFYTTMTPVPMLFVSLPDNGSDPWTLMAGFMEYVKGGAMTVDLNLGEIKLEARTEIDQVFVQRFGELHRLPQPIRANLANALGGRGNLDEALRQIEETNHDRLRSFF